MEGGRSKKAEQLQNAFLVVYIALSRSCLRRNILSLFAETHIIFTVALFSQAEKWQMVVCFV